MVVLMHAMVPHHHFTERVEATFSEGHTCPESILSSLFDLDLGSHHLEEYEAGRDQLAFTPEFIAVLLAVMEIPREIESQKPVPAQAEPLYQQHLQTYKPLRAPPALLS